MRRFISILLFFILGFIQVNAQSNNHPKVQMTLNGGYTMPLFDFKDKGYAQSSYSAGLGLDFMMSKYFGLGFTARYFNNPLEYKNREILFFNTDFASQFEKREWKSYLGAFGPIIKLPIKNKWSLDLYGKAGVAYLEAPKEIVLLNSGLDNELLLYETLCKGNLMLSGVGGIRLHYHITKHFSLDFGAEYVKYWGYNYHYAERQNIDAAIIGENIDEGLFLEQEIQIFEEQFDPTFINFNVGIDISFGSHTPKTKRPKKKKDKKPSVDSNPDQPIEEQYNCQLEYQHPHHNEAFVVKKDKTIEFIWSEPEANRGIDDKQLSYELKIYIIQNNKFIEIYKAQTDKTSYKLVIKYLKEYQDKDLYWEVNRNYSNTELCVYDQHKMQFQLLSKNSWKELGEEEQKCTIRHSGKW